LRSMTTAGLTSTMVRSGMESRTEVSSEARVEDGDGMLAIGGCVLSVGVENNRACLWLTAACFGPGSKMVMHTEVGVGDRGVLEDSRWRRCLGCKDGNRWKFLEILLSVGRERAGPKILGHMHPIEDAHL
jgi:hypothetical protein